MRFVYVIIEQWEEHEISIDTFSTKRKAQTHFDDIASRLKRNERSTTKVYISAEQDHLQVEQYNDSKEQTEITYTLDLTKKELL